MNAKQKRIVAEKNTQDLVAHVFLVTGGGEETYHHLSMLMRWYDVVENNPELAARCQRARLIMSQWLGGFRARRCYSGEQHK